jgi:hypothetical protein
MNAGMPGRTRTRTRRSLTSTCTPFGLRSGGVSAPRFSSRRFFQTHMTEPGPQPNDGPEGPPEGHFPDRARTTRQRGYRLPRSSRSCAATALKDPGVRPVKTGHQRCASARASTSGDLFSCERASLKRRRGSSGQTPTSGASFPQRCCRLPAPQRLTLARAERSALTLDGRQRDPQPRLACRQWRDFSVAADRPPAAYL